MGFEGIRGLRGLRFGFEGRAWLALVLTREIRRDSTHSLPQGRLGRQHTKTPLSSHPPQATSNLKLHNLKKIHAAQGCLTQHPGNARGFSQWDFHITFRVCSGQTRV